MPPKIDRDMLNISTYTNEKEDNFAWWFDWCKDEDPQTFWDRRYKHRKIRQSKDKRSKNRK